MARMSSSVVSYRNGGFLAFRHVQFFVNDGGAMAPDMVVLYVSFPPSTTLMSSSYVLMEKETADAKLQCL